MADIKRISPGPRISGAVVHGDTVYVAGTVAADPSVGVKSQTEQILKRIDELLANAGTSKAKILSATVWLSNMGNYDEMNAAWDAWLDKANPPARATVESHLATPKYQVEIACIAAR
jgi:enamine deaminase RidA (YjgF/YER057c/UK114 family)